MNASLRHTPNLAQRVREALRDEELATLDALFQLGCRRSERHLPRLQAFDWKQLPRSLDFGLAGAPDLNCDQIREAGRAFLLAAIDDMIESNGRSGSELEILRVMQLRLSGIPAQQLGDHLEDEAVRRRDPKTYRNWIVAYGYAQVREWAKNGVASPAATVVPDVLPDAGGSSWLPGWLRWTAAVIGVLGLATALHFIYEGRSRPPGPVAEIDPASGAVLVPVNRLGLSLNARSGGAGAHHLESVVPKRTLPNLGAPLSAATLIPKNESLRDWPDAYVPLDSVVVALGTGRAGMHSGQVTLWDPATDELLWEYQFLPRPGEPDMNPDLPADVGEEAYRVVEIAHSSPYGSLGDERIVAIFQQKFSPCFVVMLDLRTGEELARYSSYGTLYDPLIMDLDRDGEVEVVLAGTDNACDAPTLTVLDPEMSDGATSSVGWNTEGEGALWRVILPDPRALFDDYFASYEIAHWPGVRPPRLHTNDLAVHGWDPRSGRLTLPVGPSSSHHVYEATLVNGRPDFSVPVIRLGDSAEQVWRSMGLDPAEDPERVAMRAIVIEQGEGYGCPEGMEKVAVAAADK